MPTTLLEPQISEKQKSGEPDWKLHKIAKIKFYSNKKLGKVYFLNAFERHDKINFIISTISEPGANRFGELNHFILKVRRKKDGTPFVCFYKKFDSPRGVSIHGCDPGPLFTKMQEMYSHTLKMPTALSPELGFDTPGLQEKRKQWIERRDKRKKEMPATWLRKVSRLVRGLCRRNGINTRYMHRHPLAAIRQIMYPKSTELFSEAELLTVEVNPNFAGSIAKNVFGSEGRKSKALIKKICLMARSRSILTIVRSIRIYHGIDRAQTVAEAYLFSQEVRFSTRELMIKMPGEKESYKFRYSDPGYLPLKFKYIRACKHYTYKEFLKMLFVSAAYRQDVERNLEEYGIPEPSVHKTYVELHDYMAKVRARDGDDYGKPIPRPPIADSIENNFVDLSEGCYTIEFPQNTARLHEYGEWGRNCIYGYAREIIREKALAIAVLDRDGNLNSLFGFYYEKPRGKSRKGFVAHRDSSQRFNKVQDSVEFTQIRRMLFEAIGLACDQAGNYEWKRPDNLASYNAL